MASPPYSPGGRLIECRTTRVISLPGGRSSWFGESTTLIGDLQPLHPVAQLAEGDPEQLRGGGAVETGLAERLEDRLALQAVEVVRQRLPRAVDRLVVVAGGRKPQGPGAGPLGAPQPPGPAADGFLLAAVGRGGR